MIKKIVLFAIALLLINSWSISCISAQPMSTEFLTELAISYYNTGKYDAALSEFNKVLVVDPGNKQAKEYIEAIFKRDFTPQEAKPTKSEEISRLFKEYENNTLPAPVEKDQVLSREEAINDAMTAMGEESLYKKPEASEEKEGIKVGFLKISGESQLSMGSTPQDSAIWKRANADLNEKNYRIISNDAFNRRTNTYDPRIYDRLRVSLDTDNKEGIGFHSNITVDPWSFTGKSPKTTVTSAFGDVAEVELKYWSNTGYTINNIIFSDRFGNTFALPEIKVVDGKTNATTVAGAFTPADSLTIPATKIIRNFQPLREFWFDYNQEGTKIRVFPVAYQDQAYTSDDPLVLSNNHIWWQESPWIDAWVPGRVNSGVTPQDFTKGEFDDSLAYFTRDSDGTRLTALRGFSLVLDSIENLSINSTFATPKGLWQDYDEFDNISNATRLKYRLLDNLSLGSLFTYRMGLNENKDRDLANYVGGFDFTFEPLEGLELSAEIAGSKTQSDLTNPDYKTKKQGNAYNFTVTGTYPRKNIMDLKYGYYELKPEESDDIFIRYKLFATRMDEGFDPSLSDYRETRDDTFWSRHIHFRKPFQYYSAGIYEPSLTYNDLEPYRIGNGVDIGRNALGLRLETTLFNKRLDNLFDVRNVHKTNGKFIENVARDELTFRITDKLTSKLLGIYQKLPKTKGGFDPFIFNTSTDEFAINTAIEDGKDPSLKTGSLGLEYAFTDWIALSGIWEHTNDSTLAYDNFPRGVLNGGFLGTFTEYDKIFRQDTSFLYSQGLFPLPPYDFFNIWKAGLKFNPTQNTEIYLDYTRNEFKSAGQIDDNINHIGCEFAYQMSKKLGFFFRYTYSHWNDINKMLAGDTEVYFGHHNFFTEFRYSPTSDDEFSLQYGESGITPVGTITFDPFGGSLATLDTQHIVRAYYRKKF